MCQWMHAERTATSIYHHCHIIIDCIAWEIIRLAAAVCVCPSVGALLFESFDLDYWHEGQPWPWIAWDCRSRLNSENYALPFEPVVQSRSILGLGLPSSANGNCEWPLPVHWNWLFVTNHGAFNVSCISGRSALILSTAKQIVTTIYVTAS